jgi:hypothetical protein
MRRPSRPVLLGEERGGLPERSVQEKCQMTSRPTERATDCADLVEGTLVHTSLQRFLLLRESGKQCFLLFVLLMDPLLEIANRSHLRKGWSDRGNEAADGRGEERSDPPWPSLRSSVPTREWRCGCPAKKNKSRSISEPGRGPGEERGREGRVCHVHTFSANWERAAWSWAEDSSFIFWRSALASVNCSLRLSTSATEGTERRETERGERRRREGGGH